MSALVLSVVAAFTVAAGATGWIASRGRARWLIDHPNERSLHDRPVSRAGGIAILAGIACGFATAAHLALPGPGYGWVLAGGLIIASISFADDIRRISPAIRIVCHLAGSAFVAVAGLSFERIALPWAAVELGPVSGAVITTLFVAWLVNLYNFMDGMDGFASGMTVIGFSTLAILCVHRDAVALAAMSSVVAAAAFGFLLFNFPPAKVFMGDLGSSLLGYLCAVMMLSAERSASLPSWMSVLVFSPFIVDASVTLVRRVVAGERPWRAHRSHYYQRLVRLGWGHRKTVLREYALMLACAGSAAAAAGMSPEGQTAVVCVWVAIYVTLALGITNLERRAET